MELAEIQEFMPLDMNDFTFATIIPDIMEMFMIFVLYEHFNTEYYASFTNQIQVDAARKLCAPLDKDILTELVDMYIREPMTTSKFYAYMRRLKLWI